MDNFKEDYEPLLKTYGLPGSLIVVLIFVLYVAANKPENFKIYFGFIYYLLAWPFTIFRKRAVRFQIEGPTTKALKKIAKEIPEIDIPELIIKWVSEDNLAVKLKEGKAIIKLKFENDNTRNILKSTNIFVREAFLKSCKPYLNESFRKALDLIVSKKILMQIKNNQANLISLFYEENSVDDNKEVFEKCEKIEEIDDNGLMTRILLRELNHFGEKLIGRLPKLEYKEESDQFLDFVNQIATRDYDDDTPLTFINTTLKVGIILVAKRETFINHGLLPYLRRIKLGKARGIESFYLMARSEKVEILKLVAKELLATGNFILINKPVEFKDYLQRPAICYYIRINEESLFANTLKEVGDAIQAQEAVECVITEVKDTGLKLDINGVEGWIKKENLSIVDIGDSHRYFRAGMPVSALPLEIQQNGAVEFTLKNTKSDPNSLVTSNFEIGKKVLGKVSYIDDSFIKVNLGHEKIEGFVYRKDLTKSKYVFLHKKFEIDQELEFEVLGYNFERANIRLRHADLRDLWETVNHFPNEQVDFKVCKRTQRALVGELEEGIDAILPFTDLGWTSAEIDKKLQEIRLDSILKCHVKRIDKEDGLVILSLKQEKANPYQQYFTQNKDKVVDFIIDEITPYGINGTLVSPKLKIYIPKYEMSWNGESIDYRVGAKKQVFIKDIDKNKFKLIGTFKTIIPHPLALIKDNFGEGQILKHMKVIQAYNWGIVYEMKHSGKSYESILFRSDVSNNGWVDACINFGECLNDIPLQLKKIDFEKNKILLSLKGLTKNNINRQENLDYGKTYQGIVIGSVKRNASMSILIPHIWIEGILETEKSYQLGQKINVRPGLINPSGTLILIED